MKIKTENFEEVVRQIKYGKLPQLEESKEICIEDLQKKLPFTWGVSNLNQEVGLINYHRFVIIAGEGASGKTTYSIQQAMDNAKNGHKVAYMSLEMGKGNLITNIARNSAGIEKQREYGQEVSISPIQRKIFEREKEKLQNNEFLDIIGYSESLKIDTFQNELNRLCESYDMIFIDNLGMIDRGKKESEILPLLTEVILKARQKHKVTIVALHHMSKGNENQKGPRGKNAIRGSGKILDDADIILTIARDEIGSLFSIVKDRDYGLIKDFRMFFNKGIFTSDII